jgi:peptidoglycan hydrolase-like protein with peptidoglycan-binding domain
MFNAKTKIILIGTIFLLLPSMVGAVSIGQEINFNIDSSYDLYSRKEIPAVLQKITNQLYFYVDKDWWNELDYSKKQSLDVAFYDLSLEFERNIYPKLTSTFGSEPKPGIDNDEKITVLIHPMIKEAGGYFNSGDVYSKLQYPKSNEKEILYLNSQYIDEPEAKSFLAHEFVHLITANQKDLLRGVTEETWLNEARAEYVPTLLGYDEEYQGSNLQQRLGQFVANPNDSLTEWLNKKEDYGVVNLFTQYLVDHYGVKVLVDSLQSSKIGIDSINYALEKNGLKKDFSQIFADWTIAVLVNDCQLGEKYCYLNKNLKDLRITPTFYYLPRAETILSTYYDATYWSANWQRLIGGGKNLTLEFDGADFVEFEVPYLLCDLKDICSVEFFSLDTEQKGKITFSEFNTKYSSLTIVPFIKSKTSGFDGREDSFSFSWKVTVYNKSEEEREDELISRLLAQIEELKRQIAEFHAKINAILVERGQISCQRFESNLYFGMENEQVRCLQEFLKEQGNEIYSQGLVTGYFGPLTQVAVIRFQERYATEILVPLGLTSGTGFVGQMTIIKLNELLGK